MLWFLQSPLNLDSLSRDLYVLSEHAGEEDNYASFGHSFDSKNIKNMNEALEGQFCSGCLGPQITTKIGLAQPVT
jgi:hypothetical protein